ncbi:MAG: hypothetical protein IJ598_05925 [Ruminococcus sp.]|nr:hypothetical protein [Ruminococcus sp.]
MKAKSRKRLLISSVAMLLVAMLALGTATFAWFTEATSAYADNLSATSAKASKLLLSKSDRDWKQHVDYGFTGTAMVPCTSANGTDWFTTNASDGSGTRDNQFAVTSVTATDTGYLYKQELNVFNSGTIDYKDITLTLTGFETSANDYACFALVSKNTTSAGTTCVTANGTFGSTTVSTDKKTRGVVYQKTAATLTPFTATVAAGTAAPASAVGSITTVAITNGDTITVPDLAAGQAAFYDLYVWFDGTDTDCKDSLSGQTIGSLTFTVGGTQVTE